MSVHAPLPVAKVDNLSNLRTALKNIERQYLPPEGTDASQQRNAVISQLETYRNSRYHFGRALRSYQQLFKAERAWMAAVKVIADAIGRDERTVMRIIEDYERAHHLPPIVIEAAERKNAPVVDKLLEMPRPQSRDEAESAVKAAFRANQAAKRTKRQQPAKARYRDDAGEFAFKIAHQFEDRYRQTPPQERDAELLYVLEVVVATLGAEIRELKRYSQPTLVPKPTPRGAA
jgi:hypothetical protein